MPGETEIVLECASCGEITRYQDCYKHGQPSFFHKKDCSAKNDAYPKMYLRNQAINPSK